MKQDMTQDMKQMMTTKRQDMKKYCIRKMRALLSLSFLLLMLCLGGTEAWGQIVDYSGTYYIASGGLGEENGNKTTYNYDPDSPSDNFYLCPTESWCYYKPDNDFSSDGTTYPNPFLTTYRCKSPGYHNGNPSDALWIIQKAPNSNYYYIIQKSTSKYLVSNEQIRTTSNPDRIRVHLESIANPAEQGDKVLFNIVRSNLTNSYSYIEISPQGIKDNTNPHSGHTNHKWLTVNYGNYNHLTGKSGKNGGPTGYEDVSGIVCIYSQGDANAPFCLEEYITRPTITYNDATEEITITAVQLGVNLIYTTDGSTPSTSNPNAKTITGTEGNTTTVTFNPSDGETTIKAVAVVGSELSNIATYTTPVYIGENHKYLIQSIENTNFYMIQGDYTDPEIRINTSSLARPSMIWYFLDAGVTDGTQYYYMVNNKDGQYACFYKDASNKDVVCLKEATDFDSSDQFKFSIHQHASGGYFIKPLNYSANNGLNKSSGNNEASNIGVASANNATARWIFLAQSAVTLPLEDTSFNVSTDNNIYYYKIGNAGTTDPVYYIIPPTGTTGDARYVKTNSGEDENMAWFFKEADSDDWLTYYYIVNGQTGKYLYYNGQIPTDEGFAISNSPERVFTTEFISESGNVEDRYQFVIVKTTTDGQYYIVPKFLKDCSNSNYYMLWRDGTKTLRVNLQRKDASRKWTFTSTTYTCAVPEVTYDNANNQIEISSPQGVGIYYTIDGADDVVIPSSSIQYTQPLEIGSTNRIIRAVCARSADGSDNSDVVTIIFNPTITLEEESVILSDASVTYDGSGHQPTISSVEYNSNDITSECTLEKYLDKEGNVVVECINAGEYTVVITDASDGDYYVYGSTTFTINPITGVIVTPDDGQSKEYGDPDPELTYTCSGTALLTGDELTGALSRAEGETIGDTYAITRGTLGNDNYDITFTTGKTFEITKKSLGTGTTPAPNITCDVTESGGTYDVVVKQGGSNLTVTTDYTKSDEADGAKYYEVTVTGTGNYKDGFSVKLAKILLSKLTGDSDPGGAALFVSNSGDGKFVVPDNMRAYIVTGISGNTLVTEELDNIPEQVPVLLVLDIDANSFLVQTTSSGTAPIGTNMLREVTEDPSKHFDTAAIYMLYNGEFVLNMEGDLAKGKIYLPKPSGGAPAPSRLLIMWDETTSIENHSQFIIHNAQLNDAWYTLDGRRLNGQPTKKGIYLMERKKVVVK